MKLLQFIILSIVLSIALESAYAQSVSQITIITDETRYSEGDIIYVSGNVSEILFGYEVTLMVFEPNGNMILIEKIIADSNKKFVTELTTSNTLMNSSGTYTILAMYDHENSVAKTTFSYDPLTKISNQDEPEKDILLNFDFRNSDQKTILEHIDYTITVSNSEAIIFGPIPITHSSTGKVSIPMTLTAGQSHEVIIEVHKILLNPIATEIFSFNIMPESKNIQSQSSTENFLKINLVINKDPSGESKIIPEWFKNNANWWAKGLIDDDTFVQGNQYMIKEKIIDISDLPYPSSWMDKSIPLWVKNNASWWAGDVIPEEEYIKGIKYLVEKGVIRV